MPPIKYNRVAIFLGSHIKMSDDLSKAIDCFCYSYNAVVFSDHTGGYYGKFRVNFALVCSQYFYDSQLIRPDLLIHIGEVSGDTYTTGKLIPKEVWRISLDGEIRDLFGKLTKVFQQDEQTFFNYYGIDTQSETSYLDECKKVYKQIYNSLPEFEFGNLYIAKYLAKCIPAGSVLHLGIYNSLRSWNFFELDKSIQTNCNVGGFGIDGAVSTLLGASLVGSDKIHYLVLGDLAFFYDINSLGNRHISNNIRVLVINNGRGVEFRKKDHPGFKFGDDADKYIAAAGHFGNMSPKLVKHYAEDLGYEYLSACNKVEFEKVSSKFVSDQVNHSIIFEVFVGFDEEIDNLDRLRHIVPKEGKMQKTIISSLKKLVNYKL